MQSVMEAFTLAPQKSIEEVQPAPAVGYLTRRKGLDRKEQQHFTKTKKEELPFECIEMELEPTEREELEGNFRTLSSPLLGGFMVTDFKAEYELPQHRCT